MIFDGKSCSQISNDEIFNLVNLHYKERQHLEFKITVDLKDENQKLEILRDISSLANGGGGYLIVGIRDDGSGVAQKFEPSLVGDTERIRRSIRDLCLQHIQERIIGMEFECRTIDNNPVILIRVPQSDRIPHMVTFNRRTDFVSRYEDGKREMNFAEIRESFVGDLLARRLASIEVSIGTLQSTSNEQIERVRAQNATETGLSSSLLTISSGRVLSEAYRNRFKDYIQDRPFFSISAIPENPIPSFVDIDSDKFRKLLEKPPGSRWAGWNLLFEHFPIEIMPFGIQRGRDDFRLVEIWRNGYVELRALIDARFCWGQTEEEFHKQPSFNPITITEYVTAFLRFYSALLALRDYRQTALLNLQYCHVKGFRIRPRTWYYESSKSYSEEHFIISDYKLESNFNPEKTAFHLMKLVFNSFGLDAGEIPAWNQEEEKFEFEKLGK